MAPHFQSNYETTDVPIPTTRQPPASNATIRRAKTLTRPERGVAPVPLINPPTLAAAPSGARPDTTNDYNGSSVWRIFSCIVTFWAPDFLLSSLGGLKDGPTRQAWREKVTLCMIIAVLCCGIGFATVGFQKVLCPESGDTDSDFVRVGSKQNTLSIQGFIYDATNAKSNDDVDFETLVRTPGQDITAMFQRSASLYKKCDGYTFPAARDDPCTRSTPCPLPSINSSLTYSSLSLVSTSFRAGYSWDQVAALPNYFVLDGSVLNMRPYIRLHPSAIPGDNVDTALRTLLRGQDHTSGKDGTKLFYSRNDLVAAVPCLKQRYYAGNIDKVTPGCFVSGLFLYAGLIVILGLVFVRFVMACIFNWFLSERLAGPPDNAALNRSAISPAVMPGGANVSVDNKNGTAPWAGPAGSKKLNKPGKSPRSFVSNSSATLTNSEAATPIMSLSQIGAELFAVCLVTCYSEGEESLRTTLDSISTTEYSDARKLLFIVADGMITGAGEKRSTPDTCVSLLEADPRFGNPMPMAYGAVGSGAKANNRAMVYAGHYSEACSHSCGSNFA